MFRFSKARQAAVATAMMLAMGTAAHAGRTMTIRTAGLTPDPAGYLYCTVRADSSVSVDVTTRIRSASGADVSEFGSCFVASPAITDDGRFHIEADAGSMRDDARYCEVTVRGARRHDFHVTVTLESRDANGVVLASVQAY
jgi:hypothetical protein